MADYSGGAGYVTRSLLTAGNPLLVNVARGTVKTTAFLNSSYVQQSVKTYYLRGTDTGAGFVYWQSVGSANLTPSATAPALVGDLTNVCVVGVN